MEQGVLVCIWSQGSDGLPDEVEEVLTLGRTLSGQWGGSLEMVVVGDLPENAAAIAGNYGVENLAHLSDPKLSEFSADACVDALAQYLYGRSPKAVLFAQTFDARLVAPRLAGRIDAAVVMNAVSFEPATEGLSVTATAFGGDTRVVYEMGGEGPYLVCVAANAVVAEPADGGAATVGEVAVDLSSTNERIRVTERASTEGPRLEHAQMIVAGGRGLGSPENFQLVEDLAAALGGMTGASRPIVDDGWADPSRQVGLTGKITKPALYIAAGISGASQHMVGCSAAKTLVAINNDADAAIFRYARYGIVGDCLELLPEITKALKA
ncbi:MAG: electron transfer flavoprotein subunit alpha/FixB family protein [Deltaproteobacteria bacterium]